MSPWYYLTAPLAFFAFAAIALAIIALCAFGIHLIAELVLYIYNKIDKRTPDIATTLKTLGKGLLWVLAISFGYFILFIMGMDVLHNIGLAPELFPDPQP